MTGFVMRPRVGAPRGEEMDDTFISCEGTRYSAYKYAHGGAPAHYPVPAIVAKVILFPKGSPFVDIPDHPYVNFIGYNGYGTLRAPGYYTVHRIFICQ